VELLEVYPEEEVQAQRWEKISKALGSRTPRQVGLLLFFFLGSFFGKNIKYISVVPSLNRAHYGLLLILTAAPRQVASRTQKYFLKLQQSGLPIPGARPDLAQAAQACDVVMVT
jgi:hypothetical protein